MLYAPLPHGNYYDEIIFAAAFVILIAVTLYFVFGRFGAEEGGDGGDGGESGEF